MENLLWGLVLKFMAMTNNLKLFLFLLMIVPLSSNSQTYVNGFDKSNTVDYYSGQGKQLADNVKSSYATQLLGTLSNSENEIMEAYINMYYATRDVRYLNHFIIHAKRMQERRDDNLINLPLSEVGFPQYVNSSCTIQGFSQINPSSKGWTWMEDPSSSSCVWDNTHFLHSAHLCFDMAKFVYLIKIDNATNTSLLNHPLPIEATSVPSSSGCSGGTLSTFLDFANWLECRVKETVDYHSVYQWESNPQSGQTTLAQSCITIPNSGDLQADGTGSWKVKNGCAGAFADAPETNSVSALNMQVRMGSLLALLYKLTNDNNYLCKLVNIAMITKVQLNHFSTPALSSTLPQYSYGTYKWTHEYYYTNGRWEDIAHAFWTIQFATICYENGIKDFQNNDIFTISDIKRLGNSIAYTIYDQPGKMFMGVHGSNFGCPQYCITDGPGTPNPGVDPNNLAHYYGGWLAYMAKYNPYIYQIASDLYDFRAIYSHFDFILPFSYLAMAQSPYFQWNSSWSSNFKFNPVGVNTYGNSHNFKGGTIGDFDNNGSNEIILYDATRDHFRLYSVGKYSTAPSDVTLELTFSGAGNAINLASGDINSFHAGEEFITINPNNSTIYLYEQNGTSFSAITQQISGSSSWKSLVVGDFDVGHQGDEIFVLDNNGDIYLLVYDYQTQSFGVYNKGNISVASGVSITSGNFDPNNSNVQFATVENGSGHIKIFEYNTSTNTLNTTPLYTYTASGTGNQWRTMTSGDFDEDGVDELIAYRHYDGQVMMFKVKNGQLPLVYSEYFPADQEIAVLTSGKFNQFLGGDVFTVLRNYDGKLALFTMEGQCPGVSIQNTLVDGAYTIDNNYSGSQNNYVIDYHANNTLMASNNFTIVTPSEVEFTAGKKVILKPGFKALAGSKFHAYIDNQLACNTPYLRTGNTSPTENNDPELKQQIIEAFNFKVFPNPNTGNFTVYLEESNQTQTVTILNMLGEKVSQINTLEQKLEINLVSYPKGVYFVNVQSDKGSKSKKIVIN